METLAAKLKERAKTLGISHVEAARRSGIAPRSYAHYVSGRSRPIYENLLKISKALHTTPNYLLGFDGGEITPQIEQLMVLCKSLTDEQISMLIAAAERVSK